MMGVVGLYLFNLLFTLRIFLGVLKIGLKMPRNTLKDNQPTIYELLLSRDRVRSTDVLQGEPNNQPVID